MSLINVEANIHTVCGELSLPVYQEALWDLALRRLLEGPAQSDKDSQAKNLSKNNILEVKNSDITLNIVLFTFTED